MTTTDPFPELEQLASPNEMIVESLGWQFGALGAFFVLLGIALVYSALPRKETGMMLVGAGFAILGGAFAYLEIRRRENRTAVCIRGPRLGIYRRGKFDMEVTRPQIQSFETSIINTVKFSMLQVMGVVLGMLPILDAFKPGAPFKVVEILAGLILSIISGASLASLIYTRHVWKVFRLPIKARFYSWEDFCVPRQSAGILAGTQAP